MPNLFPPKNLKSLKNRQCSKAKRPESPGTFLRRLLLKEISITGEDPVERLASILGITVSTTRQMITGKKPFRECHLKKLKKHMNGFPCEEFATVNTEYEKWRSENKPRIPQTETPDRVIVSALRMIFLRSRERGRALKLSGKICQCCGSSGRKLNVHHKDGIKAWEKVISVIREEILCEPEKLEVLCEECHKLTHKKGKTK